jgi:1-acyl-sn-glycerol-3-phosphate acyltransferase
MNRALKRGDCLAIFPEDTTTDGGGVLPFHSGLLEAAVTSGALVWPVAFRYSTPEGHRSESVAFVGNQSLIQSIIRVASQPSIHLRLHFTTPFEAHERTRQVVAQKARSAILTHIDDVYPSLLAHEVDAESSG